jgi:hypothetical protein
MDSGDVSPPVGNTATWADSCEMPVPGWPCQQCREPSASHAALRVSVVKGTAMVSWVGLAGGVRPPRLVVPDEVSIEVAARSAGVQLARITGAMPVA